MPLDFAAITGLRVGGDPIPYDSSIVLDDVALRWFLGRVPRHSGGVAEYGQFVEYWDHEPASDEEAAQMARAYLLYLFGASLFPNRRSQVHLGYLAGLVDLEQAGRFDWGGAALCTLYCFLGAASRGVGDTISGSGPMRFWGCFLLRTRAEILWYLGDRVTWQSLGLPAFVVPGLLPPRVLSTESYTHGELELFTVPDTDLERHLRRTLDYAVYADRYLATSLGVEEEFERRVAGVGAQRDVSIVPSRGGRSTRGRGRGAGPSGRGEGSAGVTETAETSVPPVLPVLKWTIGVTSPSGAREVIDVPCLPQPPMRFPAQGCAKGRALQTRPAPESASPVAPQVQPRRSARTRPQDTPSLPVPASTWGRGTQSVPRPAAGARQFRGRRPSGDPLSRSQRRSPRSHVFWGLQTRVLLLDLLVRMMAMMATRVRAQSPRANIGRGLVETEP
ncbi:hypothetical protein RHMOL_Rhmol01G0110600 [Rhododendron molle]|uniref:Uncharacterized protein n=1 Tax=Rhododendron molle TaxID=49168 RepID=A0ACC0Q1M7_RHOML|nr:hypothetical protein RHMOL_Rhmol01G0110600 [Rhododendron molle]